MRPPEIHYARNADGSCIAYQVMGEGPFDLLLVPEWISNIELAWELPGISNVFAHLSSFCRVIWFDKIGTGLSDPVPGNEAPALEAWMDDIRVVMEATHCEHACVLGAGFGGMMAALFAATYPNLVTKLILLNAFARTARADDYKPGMPAEVQEAVLTMIADGWGRGAFTEVMAPSAPPAFREIFARYQRGSASPGVAYNLTRAFFETDIRQVLPVLSLPTLVLHRAGNQWARVEHGRYLAEHIPGAQYVELGGTDHGFVPGDDEALDHIDQFLTGALRASEVNRVLATVLFTDIVGSTDQAATMGDRAWRGLLENHNAVVRRELRLFHGREIDTAGDGFLATFDGPARAIRCAASIRDAVADIGLTIRVGVHTGECELMDDDVVGLAVHVGARVADLAGPGEVLVSSTVKDLVAGSGLHFVDRGTHDLKGVPGQWRVFAAEL